MRKLPTGYKRVTTRYGINGNRWIKELILKCIEKGNGISHVGEIIQRWPNDSVMGQSIPRLHCTLNEMHDAEEITLWGDNFVLSVNQTPDEWAVRSYVRDNPKYHSFVETQKYWSETWRNYVREWRRING